jgi:hypothetical protein
MHCSSHQVNDNRAKSTPVLSWAILFFCKYLIGSDLKCFDFCIDVGEKRPELGKFIHSETTEVGIR